MAVSLATALKLNPARDLTAFALVGAALLAWRWTEFTRCLEIGDELADAAQAFERETGGGTSVLVIGDSIALGTGATQPQDTIAGQLAQEFPHATIINRARNGARTVDALAQLAELGEARFDLILLNVGGNDILKRTPFAKLPEQIDALLALARQRSDHVIVTTTPNIGLVPMFFAPLSWWLTLRSRQLRDLFAATAARHGAHYVNFFHPRSSCPFSREGRRFFAPDLLHPSSDCYRFIYATLRAATPIARVLAR